HHLRALPATRPIRTPHAPSTRHRHPPYAADASHPPRSPTRLHSRAMWARLYNRHIVRLYKRHIVRLYKRHIVRLYRRHTYALQAPYSTPYSTPYRRHTYALQYALQAPYIRHIIADYLRRSYVYQTPIDHTKPYKRLTVAPDGPPMLTH